MNEKVRPQLWRHPPEQEFPFHPAAENHSLLMGALFDAIVADMRANGFDEHFPILLLEKDGEPHVVEGRNRYLAARAAGVPYCTATLPAGTNPEEVVARGNDNRRHDTPETIAARKARVKTLRAEGQSLRAIAQEVGVSHQTVSNYLGAEPEGEPETITAEALPEVVKGRDGKEYAPRKSGKVLFDWKGFDLAFHALYRQVDEMTRPFHVKESPAADALRKALVAWRTDLWDLYDAISGAKAPRNPRRT